MSSGAHGAPSQLNNEYFNPSQSHTSSLPLDDFNMEGNSLTGFEPGLDIDGFFAMPSASDNESGPGPQNTHLEIQDVFMTSQDYFDLNTPQGYFNMDTPQGYFEMGTPQGYSEMTTPQGYFDMNTPQGYFDMNTSYSPESMFGQDSQQINNDVNDPGYLIPTLQNDGFDGQYGYGSMTGDYTNQVTQLLGGSTLTAPQSLDDNLASGSHYTSVPPPNLGPWSTQSPDFHSQPGYTGQYQTGDLQQQKQFQLPIRGSPQASLTFVEYPTPPQTNTRQKTKIAQHNSPTSTPSKKTRKTSKKPTKSGEAYQHRKKHPCPQPNCTHLATCLSNLKQHMLRHSGIKRYSCEEKDCTKKFARAWGLRRHYEDVHGKKVTVQKTDGVRNASSSGQSPARRTRGRKQNVAGTGSPVVQRPLPSVLAPASSISDPCPLASLGAYSPAISGSEIPCDGRGDGAFNSPFSSSSGPGINISIINVEAANAYLCPECRCPCSTSDDLACHCHNFHNDPYSDHCGCTICSDSRQQREQQQDACGATPRTLHSFNIHASLMASTPTTSTNSTDIDLNMEDDEFNYPFPSSTTPWNLDAITPHTSQARG